jgi:RNA polymerase sigma factor (TIGR02999 family)
MDTPKVHQVTNLLRAWGSGDVQALDQLVPIVEKELKRLAQRFLYRERVGHTLQAPDLINEVYVRLIDWQSVGWVNRAQFYGVAAKLMRHVLVDYARNRNYLKRGGGEAVRVSVAEAVDLPNETDADIIALHDALTSLEKLDPECSRVVELKFYGGLEMKEIAELMTISERSAYRKWETARAWLYREMANH